MTTLLGRTSAGTTADFNVFPAAWKFTAAASGTLATIKCQTKVTNAEATTLALGIYADNAGGTRPGTQLATASTSTGITGTGVLSVDVSASAVSVTASTVYWLAWYGSNHWDFQGSTSGAYVEASAGTGLPTPTWGVGNGSGTIDAIIWGEDSGAGGAVAHLLGSLGAGT